MKINIIAACDMNGVIGINGKIPWNIQEDLKRFKELTTGHAVIMGRKTFESLPIFPLPNRLSIIVTSRKHYDIEDNLYANNLNHAINKAFVRDHEQAFIIGGEQLYREALPLADRVYLTLVNQETPIADGDEVARFPIELIDKQFTSREITRATPEYCFLEFLRMK